MIDKLDTFTMNKTTNLIITRLNELILKVNACECGSCSPTETEELEPSEVEPDEVKVDEVEVKTKDTSKKGMFGRGKK